MVKSAAAMCVAALVAVIVTGGPAAAEPTASRESAYHARLAARAARVYRVSPRPARVAALPAKPRRHRHRIRVRPEDRPDRVVVLKSRRRMVLMRGDRVIKVYRIALGRYPKGAKREQGDAKTPEGVYTIDFQVSRSGFYKALHVSYPNRQDIAQARARGVDAGGRIMIHGIANSWTAAELNHPALDWTQGCIAVTNREMDEILSLVRVPTLIEIFP